MESMWTICLCREAKELSVCVWMSMALVCVWLTFTSELIVNIMLEELWLVPVVVFLTI